MRPEPKHYQLARIEPREELAVHLLPLEGKHGLCGVPVWSERTVEPIEAYSNYTIAEMGSAREQSKPGA